MAVPAIRPQTEVPDELSLVQLRAADMLGRGMSRFEVARILESHLLPAGRKSTKDPRKRHFYARKTLRYWARQRAFRDLVWQIARDELDSRSPAILDGVARRAEAGRVDAAKLALEVAGRYVPKGTDQPVAVQIVVGGVPRPQAEVVEGEVLEEEG